MNFLFKKSTHDACAKPWAKMLSTFYILLHLTTSLWCDYCYCHWHTRDHKWSKGKRPSQGQIAKRQQKRERGRAHFLSCSAVQFYNPGRAVVLLPEILGFLLPKVLWILVTSSVPICSMASERDRMWYGWMDAWIGERLTMSLTIIFWIFKTGKAIVTSWEGIVSTQWSVTM